MLDFVPAFLLDFAIYVTLFTLQHALDDTAKPDMLALALFTATYTTVYVVGCMTLGPITDAHGRRRSSIALGAAIAGGVPLVALRLMGFVPAFYLEMVVLGIGSSLFWPALQARVAERAGEGLGAALARFNLGWTAGKALGLLLGGTIYSADPTGRVGLLVAAGAAILGAFVSLLDRETARSTVERPPPALTPRPAHLKRGFLVAALVTNAAVWGSQQTVLALVPKLGKELELDATGQGALLALQVSAQAAVFFFLRGTSSWTYRRSLLLATTPLAAAAGLWFFFARASWEALAAATAMGLLTGVSYASSLFYSLDYDERRGWRMGINEAVLGLGGLLSLAGSKLAEVTQAPRAPYLFAACACLAALAWSAQAVWPKAGIVKESA